MSILHILPPGPQFLSPKRLSNWYSDLDHSKLPLYPKLPNAIIYILYLSMRSILKWLLQICNSISWGLEYLPVSLLAGHFNLYKYEEVDVAKGKGWQLCAQGSLWFRREEGGERAGRLPGVCCLGLGNRSSGEHLGTNPLATCSACLRCAGAVLLTTT